MIRFIVEITTLAAGFAVLLAYLVVFGESP